MAALGLADRVALPYSTADALRLAVDEGFMLVMDAPGASDVRTCLTVDGDRIDIALRAGPAEGQDVRTAGTSRQLLESLVDEVVVEPRGLRLVLKGRQEP